jgi:hypothetical protein
VYSPLALPLDCNTQLEFIKEYLCITGAFFRGGWGGKNAWGTCKKMGDKERQEEQKIGIDRINLKGARGGKLKGW